MERIILRLFFIHEPRDISFYLFELKSDKKFSLEKYTKSMLFVLNIRNI